jgi:hypothetical protein
MVMWLVCIVLFLRISLQVCAYILGARFSFESFLLDGHFPEE